MTVKRRMTTWERGQRIQIGMLKQRGIRDPQAKRDAARRETRLRLYLAHLDDPAIDGL